MNMVARLVGYVWDTLYGWVAAGDDEFSPMVPGSRAHPIGQQAIHADMKRQVHEAIQLSPISPHLRTLVASPAEAREIYRVHSKEHVERIRARTGPGPDPDFGEGMTGFVRSCYEIGLHSAGGAIQATRAVLDGEVDTAYALINPPGHHASRDREQAFCLFNNVSVAAAFAREARGVGRVAIVDFDVHHGNGTQDIWWENPEVLTISLHQDRAFPITSGFRTEQGGGEGTGANLNIPLPAGSGDAVYEAAMTEVVIPALDQFQPELILAAVGFDASVLDPNGRMMVTKRGFKTMTRQLLDAADRHSDGNVVFVQEGGYSANYMPVCAIGMLEEMTGIDSGMGDPFAAHLAPQVAGEIFDHQRGAINAAAALACGVPTPNSNVVV